MPNPVVHEWFKTNIAAKVAPLLFQQTQGVLTTQKNLPDKWCTLEYDAGSRQRLTVGRRCIWRESGTATVLFLGKSGMGPEALLTAGQAFADAMEGEISVDLVEGSGTGTLHIENVSPPNGEPYEDGNWLVLSVSCIYTYDSVRGAAD